MPRAGAAYRYAHRLLSRADDLVSESFLAIYRQVTSTEKGPRYAFGSSLKAVIRNLAIKWNREAERVLSTEHLDRADPRDGLSQVEQQSESAEVISAFRELPARWHRVLWLAEVDDRSRPEIAKELGIRPDAVSAVQRRALRGLVPLHRPCPRRGRWGTGARFPRARARRPRARVRGIPPRTARRTGR